MYLDISEPNDIWRKNPQLQLLKKAKKLYEEEGEEWFNRVYHAVYMVYDPLSDFRKTTIDEIQLRREIKEGFFAEEEYSRMNWQKLRGLVAEYQIHSVTKEAKLFARLEKVLHEDTKLVEEFTPDNIKEIGVRREAMKNMRESWADYAAAKKEAMSINKQGGSQYGNTHENLAAG